MPKFFIKTYGCQMNERDSEQVAHSLTTRGFKAASRENEADVVLLNTCSVRDMADQKALGKMGMLGALAKKRPEMVFGFLGCMAQARGESLLQGMPHVDLVVGTQKFHRVADYVFEIWERKNAARLDDLRHTVVDVEEEIDSQNTIAEQTLRPGQASAFVSIMQGCNMRCTFCIVPQTRGAERGRPLEQIVREVRQLAERGVKEVTLLGQIVNLYGRHEIPLRDGKTPFVQLLEAIHGLDGIDRIRFTSPHPIGFKADLIECYRRLPKLAPHVHLPVQSGSNRILKAMHRAYTAERYTELVGKLRTARPDLALTTDIIVGFPGEEDGDYEETRRLVQAIEFDNAFIFRYSTRQETPAAIMEMQVPERIKEERNQDLLSLVNSLARKAGEKLVGREVEILCEGPSKTNPLRLTGRTGTNKIVHFAGGNDFIGKFVSVQVESATGFSLAGRFLGARDHASFS